MISGPFDRRHPKLKTWPDREMAVYANQIGIGRFRLRRLRRGGILLHSLGPSRRGRPELDMQIATALVHIAKINTRYQGDLRGAVLLSNQLFSRRVLPSQNLLRDRARKIHRANPNGNILHLVNERLQWMALSAEPRVGHLPGKLTPR